MNFRIAHLRTDYLVGNSEVGNSLRIGAVNFIIAHLRIDYLVGNSQFISLQECPPNKANHEHTLFAKLNQTHKETNLEENTIPINDLLCGCLNYFSLEVCPLPLQCQCIGDLNSAAHCEPLLSDKQRQLSIQRCTICILQPQCAFRLSPVSVRRIFSPWLLLVPQFFLPSCSWFLKFFLPGC